MRKIKILHLTSTPHGIGGVERLLLDMAAHYDRDRFSVAHCNLFDETGGEGPFPTALRATGLPCFEIEGRRWNDVPRLVRELVRLIRREQIDVLHLHMVHATIVGGLTAWLLNPARVVLSKHYQYAMLSGRFARLLDRTFTNRAEAVAAVSQCVQRDLVRHGMAPGRTRVIYNGIDLKMFDRRAAEKTPLARDGGGPLLACLGSLHPVKGQEFLLRAMPDILRQHPGARLFLIGEGRERARLEQMRESLGIRDVVMMPGFQRNVPAILPQIDLCVHPSVDEAFGLVLLEAMAAGKAVVATSVGGIPEIVAEGRTGLLVPPRDPAALARAVCTVLADPEQRANMGAAGRARVEQEFTIQKTMRDYETLYSQLMGNAR